MSFLFRFQKFITVTLITDWLNCKEFIDLDTSLCNIQERKILLEFIKSFPHPFGKLLRDSLVIPLSVEIYQWAESRRFDLSYLSRAIIDGKFVEKTNWLSYFSAPKVKAYAPCLKTVQVTESGLSHFKQTLPYANNLEDVDFTGVKSPPVMDLVKCVNLTKLDFNGCIDIQEADVVSLVHLCPALTSLFLKGCKNMKKGLAKALIVRGRSVERLDLRQCYQIDKTWIRMMIFLLRRVVVFGRDYLSDFSSRQLVWYRGRELERLALVKSVRLANGDTDFVQDETLSHLGRACHRLTKLDVSDCWSLTNKGLEALVQGDVVTQTLLVVNLQGLSLLSGSAIRTLTGSCPQLKEIYLKSQCHVKEGGLRSIGTNCKNLRKLSLVDMKHLTGDILLYIASECRRLETLNLCQCAGLTDRDTLLALPHLSNLSNLNLNHCNLLSDVTMIAVSRHCLYLTEVYIDGCILVTIRGVSAVMGNSRLLKKMSFTGIRLANSWNIPIVL